MNEKHLEKYSHLLHIHARCQRTASIRDPFLMHTHLGSRPFHQLPRPFPFRILMNCVFLLLGNIQLPLDFGIYQSSACTSCYCVASNTVSVVTAKCLPSLCVGLPNCVTWCDVHCAFMLYNLPLSTRRSSVISIWCTLTLAAVHFTYCFHQLSVHEHQNDWICSVVISC